MSLNANEKMLADNADADASYPDSDPDADLCIRIMYCAVPLLKNTLPIYPKLIRTYYNLLNSLKCDV